MKNLEKFASQQIPQSILKFLKGGTYWCGVMEGCVETAYRDGNEFLIDDCVDTFQQRCMDEML